MSDRKFNTSIVGGMFGLQTSPDEDATFPPFLSDNYLLMINARSSIWHIAETLKPKQVWCPSYLCHTLIDAVEKTNSKLRFYEIDDKLSIPSNDWIRHVENGDIVIFINYFGFPTENKILLEAKEAGAWLVLDSSQTLFSSNSENIIDFTVYSPRKIIGIVDGGVICQHSEIALTPRILNEPTESWWLKAFHASTLRRDFDLMGNNKDWFNLFQETEKDSPIGAFKMSEFSKMIMFYHFNYNRISYKRRENYKQLATRLGTLAIYPQIPDNVVPLGFPIKIDKRDIIREFLFTEEIFPPIHWNIDRQVPKKYRKSHKLSTEIMTIPCDQRYGIDTMDRIADLILKVIH
jgi:dTDP-4-amino-4,6-dideoxygalactose transaminase